MSKRGENGINRYSRSNTSSSWLLPLTCCSWLSVLLHFLFSSSFPFSPPVFYCVSLCLFRFLSCFPGFAVLSMQRVVSYHIALCGVVCTTHLDFILFGFGSNLFQRAGASFYIEAVSSGENGLTIVSTMFLSPSINSRVQSILLRSHPLQLHLRYARAQQQVPRRNKHMENKIRKARRARPRVYGTEEAGWFNSGHDARRHRLREREKKLLCQGLISTIECLCSAKRVGEPATNKESTKCNLQAR